MFEISVCIPAYNRPEEFKELLETVVTQDYDNFEIVISEDCSPLAEEIAEISQRFIRDIPKFLFTIRVMMKIWDLMAISGLCYQRPVESIVFIWAMMI